MRERAKLSKGLSLIIFALLDCPNQDKQAAAAQWVQQVLSDQRIGSCHSLCFLMSSGQDTEPQITPNVGV